MTSIEVRDSQEHILINHVGGVIYDFSGADLISALELFINTKKEMEEENGG
jgi:hypothetical protein